RFSVNQDGRFRFDDFLEQAKDVLHRPRVADDVLEAVALAELLGHGGQLALTPLELAVIVLDFVGAELEEIAQLRDLGSGDRGDAAGGRGRRAAPAAGRDLTHLAHELLGRRRRQTLVDAPADEEKTGELSVENDRAGDDVEAEMALVHDAAPAPGA